jgi:Ni/Co efflux regulator RcnB
MKASLFSFVAAVALFAATAVSAAPLDRDHDLRRLSPRERARYEQAQRTQARYEQAQRERERRQAIERARYEQAQRRYDRGPARPYGR